MRVKITKSKNSESFYIIKSIYENGKNTSMIVEKLGTLQEVTEKANGQDPYLWAKQRAIFLTEQEKLEKKTIFITLSNSKLIDKEDTSLFNVGFLPLQKLYYELQLDTLCSSITQQYKFEYDLNAILSSLLYSRIIYPSSKTSSFELSKQFLTNHSFDLHHIYRSLDILAKESARIQQYIYEKSLAIIDRNSTILYYDCTSFFIEIEEAAGLKQYGKSKEHRANPIIQMGLFLDGSGIPLAFNLNPGNTNEQVSLKPFEKRVLKDFHLSELVVFTDVGLSSITNKKFNDHPNRGYITVQSLMKLKKHLQDWAIDSKGWHLKDSDKEIDLADVELENNPSIYYKECWIHENGLEERFIVTFSPKYKLYQENIRNKQIERTIKQVESGRRIRTNRNQNNPTHFISETYTTEQGEVANDLYLTIDEALIDKEKQLEGFYGVVTNVDSGIDEILKVNQGRWEIEETFRIMKSEFKARPVYLRNDERIEAHFLTCFISMVIFRILEKRLHEEYTAESIIKALKDMNVLRIRGTGYLPTFKRTDITDKIQNTFDFQLSTQIIDKEMMRKNKQISKTKKVRKMEQN